ncbi:MAG: energy transducer TonB [Bacteroidales bacterium]|nr:energy transducer TonB [Bacteroidales bacterium]
MTNKDKNRIVGIVVTTVFHAVALVLLLTLCFTTPLPLPGEAGVEVDMGMYAHVNETSYQQVEETSVKEVVEETDEIEEDILSEDEDVPEIEEEIVEEVEEVEEEVIEEIEEEKPVVNQRALFQAPKVKDDTSDSIIDNIGDKGNPNSLKDIDRYDGHGGSGGGPAYDLGGRGAKSISTPSRDFKEEGKVVVDIWVDKEGRVQRTEIGKGTTVTDSNMLESAKRAAYNSIFNKDEKAADLQRGTITYTFIMRQ